MFYQFIDVATNELSDRFTRSGDMRQYERLEQVLLSGCTDDSVRSLIEPYSEVDWGLFKLQMPLFRKQAYTTSTEAVQVLQSMSVETRELFSEVVTFVRLLLVCPASSAEAERSFSALRRLKTWLRNRMSQERLNDLAVCHIHKNIVMQLDLVSLMKEFVARGRESVRKHVFGQWIC